jgi:selenocysteine lyase/cysteine desulfurase
MTGLGALLPSWAASASVAPSRSQSFSHRGEFPFEGIYLDAAFVHPFGAFAAEAASRYALAKVRNPQSTGPGHNARKAAIERFARLVNAGPTAIAIVPSTMTGENLVNAALGIGPRRGVVTDALHYDASLVLYGELRRRGAPVGVAYPRRDWSIDLADIRALITPETRLIAVSLVSSKTGFEHDLAELCAVAHRHDVLVYADIIQAAGSVPIDVRESGVDFACCGTYKWLMGDFGTAFLYVRPDRLPRLRRVQTGWRQIASEDEHIGPYDDLGSVLEGYELASDAAGIFELSTPAWQALAVAVASLDFVANLGVRAISAHRKMLLDGLRDSLPSDRFMPLTPKSSRSPIVTFAVGNARERFDSKLQQAGIKISTYRNAIRISPSIYNGADDVDRLARALTA